MRLVYGKASLETVRRSMEALHAARLPALEAAAQRYRALAAAGAPACDAAAALRALARCITASNEDLMQAAIDFAVAAAQEEARRVRALEATAAKRWAARRRLRTEVAAVAVWTEAVMDLAEAIAARLTADLHARFEAALQDAT